MPNRGLRLLQLTKEKPLQTKVYRVPAKRKVTVDTKIGSIFAKERYITKEVPDTFQIDAKKWRYLDEQKGYVEIDITDGEPVNLEAAPEMTDGQYAQAVRVIDGKILEKPVFLPDELSQRRGTITCADGKTYLQGSEYKWKACAKADLYAKELQKPIPVKPGDECIIEFEEGVPKDCGVLDEDLGVPVRVITDKAKLLGLVEPAPAAPKEIK